MPEQSPKILEESPVRPECFPRIFFPFEMWNNSGFVILASGTGKYTPKVIQSQTEFRSDVGILVVIAILEHNSEPNPDRNRDKVSRFGHSESFGCLPC